MVEDSWATPVVVDLPSGKQEIVLSAHGTLYGFDPEKGRQLWRLVASSPNMASLERLWINWGGLLENHAVEALIQSPYLKASLRLDLDPPGEQDFVKAMLAHLRPAKVKALRKRFPGGGF